MAILITEKNDFDALLKVELAYLLAYEEFNENYPQSQEMKSILKSIERRGVRIYVIEPWNSTFAFDWLYNEENIKVYNDKGQLTSISSNGALLKLTRGVIDKFLFNVNSLPDKTLNDFFFS